jgi:hypothetical protein
MKMAKNYVTEEVKGMVGGKIHNLQRQVLRIDKTKP